MILLQTIKTNNTNVPSKNQETKEWIIGSEILINSDSVTVETSLVHSGLCILYDRNSKLHFFVPYSLEELNGILR